MVELVHDFIVTNHAEKCLHHDRVLKKEEKMGQDGLTFFSLALCTDRGLSYGLVFRSGVCFLLWEVFALIDRVLRVRLFVDAMWSMTGIHKEIGIIKRAFHWRFIVVFRSEILLLVSL
jgi:hypothetical protein